MYTIKSMTEVDKANHLYKFPLSNPLDYAVIDEDQMVMGFYSTHNEAQQELFYLNLQENVRKATKYFVNVTLKSYVEGAERLGAGVHKNDVLDLVTEEINAAKYM